MRIHKGISKRIYGRIYERISEKVHWILSEGTPWDILWGTFRGTLNVKSLETHTTIHARFSERIPGESIDERFPQEVIKGISATIRMEEFPVEFVEVFMNS